jgi:glycerophosphoryl diester phosphodiesterase
VKAALKPLIIAHRGASAFAPENTFAAFQTAFDDGADGIEFDVRLAKDGVPVVFHDSTLQRLAKIEAQIADYTSEELNKIDVGTWFNEKFPAKANEKFSAETVPTLAQLLNFLSGYKNLIYVELKSEGAEIIQLVEIVCRLLQQTNLLPNIIVKSFNLTAVQLVKQILPETRTAALFEPTIQMILRKQKLILDAAQDCRADELSIHYSLATEKFVSQAVEQNLPVTIWTADNPAWVKRALNRGINAIITNNPVRLLKERSKIKS